MPGGAKGRPKRAVRTIVFTDISRSTERVVELGDARWRALLDRHDEVLRDGLARDGGREVKTLGDGFLAVFEAPTDAVTWAARSRDAAMADLGLSIRAGIHSGECELRGDDVAGIAVITAARLADAALPGQILVSGTARELAAGSEHRFVDRGQQRLKGARSAIQVWVLDGHGPVEADAASDLPAVMLVDDHPMWRETLRQVVEAMGVGVVVAEAGDAEQAVAESARLRPDVIVMDIDLPGSSGIVAAGRIIHERPGARILMLSSSDDRSHVTEALRAGASGYLVKTTASREVADAIKRIHGGELVFPADVAGVVLEQLRGTAPSPAQPASKTADTATFQRRGQFWAVGLGDAEVHLKDARGLGYIAALLERAGQEVHVLELVASASAAKGGAASKRAAAAKGAPSKRAAAPVEDPLLDRTAIDGYRQRIADLRDELAEAESWDDDGRAERARVELQQLEAALASALGLGGRSRSAATDAERARVAVRNAIAAALKTIRAQDEPLGLHLSKSIRTGTFCAYEPERAVVWSL